MVVHSLIDVQIGAGRGIEAGEQLINNDQQLHICWFVHKLPLCFFLKFFYFLGNLCLILSRINTDHL